MYSSFRDQPFTKVPRKYRSNLAWNVSSPKYTLTVEFDNDTTYPIRIVTDSSKNVYTIKDISTSVSELFYVTKHNSSGVLQNTFGLYFQSNKSDLWLEDIAVDSSGNMYLCGGPVNAISGTTFNLAKVSSSGMQWARGDSLGPASYMTGVAIDSSSNIYVAGWSSNAKLYVAKYNSSGTVQWQRNFALTDTTSHARVAVDSSANVYVTAIYQNSSGGLNLAIVKYNTSGVLQWQQSLADSNTAVSQYVDCFGIATDSSGNLYISGRTKSLGSSGTNRGFVAKYNTSGVLQWQRVLSASGGTQDLAITNGIAVDSSANVYVTGYYYDANSDSQAFVIKYNTSGVLQWQRGIVGRGSGIDIAFNSPNIYVLFDFLSDEGSTVYQNTGQLTITSDPPKTASVSFGSYANISIETLSNIVDTAGNLVSSTPTFTDSTLTNTILDKTSTTVYTTVRSASMSRNM